MLLKYNSYQEYKIIRVLICWFSRFQESTIMEEEECEHCVIPTCTKRTGSLCTAGKTGIKSIKTASVKKEDGLNHVINNRLSREPPGVVKYHKSCFTNYRKLTDTRGRKRKASRRSQSEPPLRRRRLELPAFDFKVHCIFCGEVCEEKDPKNPQRWKEYNVCQTWKRQDGKDDFKTAILKVCDARQDEAADDVRVRLAGAPSDLRAVESRWHHKCRTDFMGERNIKSARRAKEDTDEEPKADIRCLVEHMEKPAQMSTTRDLYQLYLDSTEGSNPPSKRKVIKEIQSDFGERLVKININGCASLLCLKGNLPANMKLVQDEDDSKIDVQKLFKQIQSECATIDQAHFYDLEQFSKNNIIRTTSKTLLHLVIGLMSSGDVTKASLSISQMIQAKIQKCWNQTTLGNGVKYHHKYGSKTLIDDLHECGVTASYDEILRFRSSAAQYARSQPFSSRGLQMGAGALSVWVDNYDLNIFTPNGCRGTHALATEVTQHPLPTDENRQQPLPKIPRLKKMETSRMDIIELPSNALHHYQGPSRPLPPPFPDHDGVPFTEVSKTMENLGKALQSDTEWLAHVLTNEDLPMEWPGYMNHVAREKGFISKSTNYVYGPLIDASPSHPDTILTSMLYLEEFFKSHGKKYLNLVADLQIFKVIMQIKWSDTIWWKNLVVRPGGMHTLMSFLGCVDTLMKGTGLEEILGVAFKGIPNILNGKSRPKAL